MKFRIATLLWLTLAVACFFAGMSWDELSERLLAPKIPTASVRVGQAITLTVPSKSQIPRAMVSDPNVASVTASSPTSILLTGKSQGTTTVVLWDAADVPNEYTVTVKPKSAQKISWFVGFQR